jgi:hypothetical protein
MSLQQLIEKFKQAREKAHSGEWSDLGEPGEVHAIDWQDHSGDPLHICEDISDGDAQFIILSANEILKLIQCCELMRDEMLMLSDEIPHFQHKLEIADSICEEPK